MKKLSIYDDVHRDVKIEAARHETSVPNMASELIRWALAQLKAGKIKPEAFNQTAPVAKPASR